MRGARINKEQYVLAQSRTARSILHIGCTSAPNTFGRWQQGTLLHKKLCDRVDRETQRVVGIDIDQPSLKWLRERMPRDEILYADAERLGDYFGLDVRFELIIAGDVIEHLPNPGLFLASSREHLTPDGRILLTTVNAFGVVRFLKALLDHEAVHPEHTAYYSGHTLGRLFTLCGLQLTKLGYYKCEPLTRLSLNGIVSNATEHTLAFLWPQFSEGIVAEARIAATTA
jgi:2-polyprenyl-3-methyl-5-hydroxy-6-metoxy-1,4-benzoquinol methylase